MRTKAVGSPASPDASPTEPDEDETPQPLQEAFDLIAALSTEFNELRLELWRHQSEDASEASSPPAAADLLDRLGDALTETKQMVGRLRRDRRSLRNQNAQLEREVERL
ncbi:MAG: hypothetical protein BRD55_07905 [Bacteroidetes bacterium SW_9_63_38]|nr:MAG: hypothetical protein BRD55_07905 [Bacteroidetes bacterium SW_9_63_38]